MEENNNNSNNININNNGNSSFKSFFSKLFIKFQNHAFRIHPRGHAMFHDIDELISLKDNFIDYIKFEYSLAIFYNIIISLPSFIYLCTKFDKIINCDKISTLWLFLVSIIKLIELLPKGIIIYQTIRISNNSTDNIVCTRRLMYMTRSNIFYYNSLLGNTMLFLYTAYFLCLRRSNSCEEASQFYYLINWLVFGFFLRLIISFINYYLHFKYGVNEADISSEGIFDYENGVSQEILNSLETKDLTVDNINEYIRKEDDVEHHEECSICLYPFKIDQQIKIMPCDIKHFFHRQCIDKWLGNHKACPMCRKEIKKPVNKRKYY